MDYAWTGRYSENSETYFFRGFKNSLLQYDKSISGWKLTSNNNPSIYATWIGSDYPFGTHDWLIYGDTCKNVDPKQVVKDNVYKMALNLNGCDPSYEFNCVDGTW